MGLPAIQIRQKHDSRFVVIRRKSERMPGEGERRLQHHSIAAHNTPVKRLEGSDRRRSNCIENPEKSIGVTLGIAQYEVWEVEVVARVDPNPLRQSAAKSNLDLV